MSRTSRIPHPLGGRFVQIQEWAVKRWGLAEAAIVGLLDFYDRGQQDAGMPLASRQRIVADLEGIVGRDAVDKGLRTLVDDEVLKAKKTTTPGVRNLQTRIDYCLCVDGITRILSGTPDFRSSGNSQIQDCRQLLNPVLNSGVPSVEVDIEVVAAAPRAAARGTAGAAAAAIETGKVRKVRESGIVTWCASDVPAAQQIEKRYGMEVISAAVIAVSATKDPVPGLITREITRQRSIQQAAQRRAAAEMAYQARLSAPVTNPDITANQAAIKRGDEILAQLRQKQSAAR